jgi:hypothetical protein
VADEEPGDRKGGRKHTPGRGHRRKSEPQKKRRFRRKAATKHRAENESLRARWDEWNAMLPEQQRLLPDKKPKKPRPEDES